jgi:hypothetical protein
LVANLAKPPSTVLSPPVDIGEYDRNGPTPDARECMSVVCNSVTEYEVGAAVSVLLLHATINNIKKTNIPTEKNLFLKNLLFRLFIVHLFSIMLFW